MVCCLYAVSGDAAIGNATENILRDTGYEAFIPYPAGNFSGLYPAGYFQRIWPFGLRCDVRSHDDEKSQNSQRFDLQRFKGIKILILNIFKQMVKITNVKLLLRAPGPSLSFSVSQVALRHHHRTRLR